MLAKARAPRSARPSAPHPAAPGQPGELDERAPSRLRGWGLLGLGALALAGATWLAAGRKAAPGPPPSAGTPRVDVGSDPPAPAAEVTVIGPPPAVEPMAAPHAGEQLEALVAAARAAQADRDAAAALASRIDAGRPVGPGDLRVAEDLFARYPDQARGLLESALLAGASQAREARRYAEATALLERAAAVAPRSPNARRGLMAVRADVGDWPGVEAAARALLGLLPADGGAIRTLAYALVRQDRTREAVELLSAFLASHADPEAAAMADRLRRERAAEGGFEEQRLAHFHVRYDGEAHEDVGREILRVLDRHYVALRAAFGHEPAAPIPVVLFSTRSYYDATGAPAWSGGEYDHFDGRIRVPIGGLTASLTPDLESTLLHEVTHAFVTDLSAGLAPREIQEGLAQWTEGKRSDGMLGDRGMRALADGRIQGVTGFYLASLVLVEDLIAQRGRSGINDLLAAMARTRDVDAAFQEVYGRSFAGLQTDTATRLRQRHGS
jgi:hypothetical protein